MKIKALKHVTVHDRVKRPGRNKVLRHDESGFRADARESPRRGLSPSSQTSTPAGGAGLSNKEYAAAAATQPAASWVGDGAVIIDTMQGDDVVETGDSEMGAAADTASPTVDGAAVTEGVPPASAVYAGASEIDATRRPTGDGAVAEVGPTDDAAEVGGSEDALADNAGTSAADRASQIDDAVGGAGTPGKEEDRVTDAGFVVSAQAASAAAESKATACEAASEVYRAALPGTAQEKDKIEGSPMVTAAVETFPGEIIEDATDVDAFAAKISTAWHKGIDAILTAALYCAQADKLSPEEKKELVPKLPFGPATFSKLVGIGNDVRLRTPEIKRLLPPHYTTLYFITTLNDDELTEATAERVIHAEVKRGGLEKWRKERRRRVEAVQVAHGMVATDAVTSSTSATELAEEEAERQSELALESSCTEALSDSNVAPGEAMRAATNNAPRPATAPVDNNDLSARPDCRALSFDEQRQFDALVAAYEAAPQIVRERFKSVEHRLDSSLIQAA